MRWRAWRPDGRVIGTAVVSVALAATGMAPSPGGAASEGTDTRSGVAGALDAVTITYLTHFDQPPGSEIEQAVAQAFEASHPGVTVEIVASPDDFTKFQTLASAGTPPDIYLADSTFLAAILSFGDLMAPVDYSAMGAANRDELAARYLPGALAGYIRNDELFAVPAEYSNYQAWVNVEAFREAGLGVPTTWDEVCDNGPAMLRREGASITQMLIALPTNLPDGQAMVLDAIAREFGGSLFSDDGTESHLTSAPVVDALSLLQRLAHDCQASFPSLNSSEAGADRIIFGTGQAAMMLTGGAWFAGTLERVYPDVAPPITAPARYPTVGDAEPGSVAYGYGWLVAKGPNQGLSWEFVKALSETGDQWFTEMGLFNGTVAVADSAAAASNPDWVNVWRPSLETSHYVVSLTNAAQIYDILGTAINEAILTEADVAGALSGAESQIVPLLNRP